MANNKNLIRDDSDLMFGFKPKGKETKKPAAKKTVKKTTKKKK